MIKLNFLALSLGGLLVIAPALSSSEPAAMSDTHHRKTVGGSIHHPEHAGDVNKGNTEEEKATMSNAQHRKTMGGLHHPDTSDDKEKSEASKKKDAAMSDSQHRKTMGGSIHHSGKE